MRRSQRAAARQRGARTDAPHGAIFAAAPPQWLTPVPLPPPPPPPPQAEKAWEAIISAPEVARGYSQQIVETEHLLKALLEQPAGLARRIVTKAGLNPTQVGGGGWRARVGLVQGRPGEAGAAAARWAGWAPLVRPPPAPC